MGFVWFSLGLFVGSGAGILLFSLCQVASLAKLACGEEGPDHNKNITKT